jgi:adenylate cyclase
MNTEILTRRLSAILSADVEGYSRLMREDEEATVHTITTHRAAMTHMIEQYRGRVVDSPGDNILAEFTSVVDAVNCGVEIQRELAERNEELPDNRRMRFRIGINLGDVLEEGDRIYGDGVNIAARMESLADAGGICISGTVYDAIENKIGLEYEYLGEHEVKNIDKPIRAYKVLSYPGAAAHRVVKAKRAAGKLRRNTLLAIAAILVIVVAVGVWFFYFRPPPIEPASVDKMAFPLPDKPSIAVLPFDNLTGDPKQEYFSDGLTEEIITTLSKAPGMFVIARNSTFTYKGKPVKIQQVAEDLGVRYVLEGSVRRAGDRVRVTAQLIDAIKGHHLWAESYDRELKDIFALQDEITRKILSALEVRLWAGEQASTHRKVTDNLEAYLKTLQASVYLGRLDKEGTSLARQLAEEAMALDPNYARPYGILASCHTSDVFYGWSKSPRESLEQALELAQKAISLDETNPGGHMVLSSVYMFKREYERAIAEAERAIALDPNYSPAYSQLGLAMQVAGMPQESIAPLEKAIRINPMAPAIYFRRLGGSYSLTGRYEDAIVQLKKGIRLGPDDIFTHILLAATYAWKGSDEEAHAEVSEVLRIQPGISLEAIAKRSPLKNKDDRDRFIDALRKAGLK